jgi:hypothetical protein
MDNVKAVMLIEGEQRTDYPEEILEAWQYLVDSGMAWRLQGSYGRTAMTLIEEGLITCEELD